MCAKKTKFQRKEGYTGWLSIRNVNECLYIFNVFTYKNLIVGRRPEKFTRSYKKTKPTVGLEQPD